MAITVTEINTELESRLGVTIGAASLYPEVNRALNVISKLARWPDLRTTDSLSFAADDKYKAFVKEWSGRRRPNGRMVLPDSVCTDCHGNHAILAPEHQIAE